MNKQLAEFVKRLELNVDVVIGGKTKAVPFIDYIDMVAMQNGFDGYMSLNDATIKGMLEDERINPHIYSGLENPEGSDKEARRIIGLPVTKQLIYYKDKRDENSVVKVDSYRVVEEYNLTDKWFTLELGLEDGSLVNIHSSYFIDMQKPTFIEDIEKDGSLNDMEEDDYIL